jgi:hypothetical protein
MREAIRMANMRGDIEELRISECNQIEILQSFNKAQAGELCAAEDRSLYPDRYGVDARPE